MSTPRRLKAFPRHRLIAHEVLRCRAHELDLLTSLGEPTSQTDPRDAEPVFFWDLEWPCGLVTAVALHQLDERLTLHLDEPEVPHALRHLGVDPVDSWLWQEADPVAFAAAVPEPPEPSWSVWRQVDQGRRTCLASGITERDARCWVDELEAAEPGVHWAERLRSFPGSAPLPSRSAGPPT